MSDFAESFGLVATLAEDESITVNELAARMGADSRFARMVLMQAFAEGFDILRNVNSPAVPENRRYQLNLPDIAEVWRRGSVVSSWLLDLTAIALAEDPNLTEFTGSVADSGEGRWTILAAIEQAVPADVLSAALYTRFRSRQEHTFAEKILSAMRREFGGHQEAPQG